MILKVNSPKYGEVAVLFDDDFYETIKDWSIYIWGSKRHTGLYVMLYQPGNSRVAIRSHRLVLGAKPGEIVDHINGNPLDNRRENLRITTSLVNNQNAKKRRDGITSKFKGVHFCSASNRWKAQIQVNKKKLSLGSHKTEIEAANAYNTALDLYKVSSPKNITDSTA